MKSHRGFRDSKVDQATSGKTGSIHYGRILPFGHGFYPVFGCWSQAFQWLFWITFAWSQEDVSISLFPLKLFVVDFESPSIFKLFESEQILTITEASMWLSKMRVWKCQRLELMCQDQKLAGNWKHTMLFKAGSSCGCFFPCTRESHMKHGNKESYWVQKSYDILISSDVQSCRELFVKAPIFK